MKVSAGKNPKFSFEIILLNHTATKHQNTISTIWDKERKWYRLRNLLKILTKKREMCLDISLQISLLRKTT